MNSIEKNNIVFVRLFKDEDITSKIKKACLKHNIKTAVVLSGIGQIKKTKLGYFVEKGNYSPQDFKDPLELLCLTGNIVREKEEYILHLHVVLGDKKKNAFGGHLLEGKISITGEIVLLKTDIDAKRITDEETGLKSLSI